MINPFKKYLYISLALHLFVVAALLILTGNDNNKQPFIVFGAYSKKPAHTLYKVRSNVIPFTQSSVKNNLKSNTKRVAKTSAKKESCKKSDDQKTNKIAQAAKKESNSKSISSGNNKPRQATTINEKKQEAIIEKKFQEELKKMELEAQKAIAKEDTKKKKPEQEIKRTEPKPEIKQEPAPKQEPIPEPEINQETIPDQEIEEPQEEFIFSLSGPVDKKFELYQKYLQQEVQRLWAPPLGVPKGTTCRIKFMIDKDGKITDFENIKKSNVLIYDLSILRIAHLFKFDKCLWGKSFTIDFCQ